MIVPRFQFMVTKLMMAVHEAICCECFLQELENFQCFSSLTQLAEVSLEPQATDQVGVEKCSQMQGENHMGLIQNASTSSTVLCLHFHSCSMHVCSTSFALCQAQMCKPGSLSLVSCCNNESNATQHFCGSNRGKLSHGTICIFLRKLSFLCWVLQSHSVAGARTHAASCFGQTLMIGMVCVSIIESRESWLQSWSRSVTFQNRTM